jgi:hypothetical protein
VQVRPAGDDGRVQTRRDAEGKSCPAQMPPPRAWRWEVVALTHHLAHEVGLTERLTRLALAVRGYRRSTGSVHYDLTRPMPACSRCCPPPDRPSRVTQAIQARQNRPERARRTTTAGSRLAGRATVSDLAKQGLFSRLTGARPAQAKIIEASAQVSGLLCQMCYI